MASAALQNDQQQNEELEECVTYQHINVLETAGIGLFLSFISGITIQHIYYNVNNNDVCL